VSEVRSAIHVRTGQRELSEAVDIWLRHHGVATIALADAYEACLHLLRNQQRAVDLALIGADWLADDEFRVLTFLRQTWQRTPVLVYGASNDLPCFDAVPLVVTCRGAASLEAKLAQPPGELVRRITGASVSLVGRGQQPAGGGGDRMPGVDPAAADPGAVSTPFHAAPGRLVHQGLTLSEPEPPRTVLTAAELSALLDLPEQA